MTLITTITLIVHDTLTTVTYFLGFSDELIVFSLPHEAWLVRSARLSLYKLSTMTSASSSVRYRSDRCATVSIATDHGGMDEIPRSLVSQVSLVSVSSNDPVIDIIHVTPIQHSDH